MTYVKEFSVAKKVVAGVMRRSVVLCAVLLLSACGSLSSSELTAARAPAGPQAVPAAAQAQFAAALAAQRAQQWDEAERQFNQLLTAYPQLSGPAFNLALIYAQTQRSQLAETFFMRALTINPNNAEAGDQYGIWLRAQGRFDDAERVYLQIISSNPEYADAHLNLAILYDLYLGKAAQALPHYQRYLELTNDEKSPVHGWVSELQRRLQSAG